MRIDDCLAGVKTVGITGHVRPDGDCTGSCLGLYNYINDNYPQIDVDIYLEQPGAEFNYLTGIDSIKNGIVIDHIAAGKAKEVYDALV